MLLGRVFVSFLYLRLLTIINAHFRTFKHLISLDKIFNICHVTEFELFCLFSPHTVFRLQMFLVFCPNMIMFLAFVFWGVSEGECFDLNCLSVWYTCHVISISFCKTFILFCSVVSVFTLLVYLLCLALGCYGLLIVNWSVPHMPCFAPHDLVYLYSPCLVQFYVCSPAYFLGSGKITTKELPALNYCFLCTILWQYQSNVCLLIGYQLFSWWISCSVTGSLNESVSCSALYFLRPLMLLWVAPYVDEFTGIISLW